MHKETLNFISDEFTGIQKERALKIFQNTTLSKIESKRFYANWLVNIKFDLRRQLNKYDNLNFKFNMLNKIYKRNTKIQNNNVLFLDNYMIKLKSIRLDITELNQTINEAGYNIQNILREIERLNLFNAMDISTVFTIPINSVKLAMDKYKDDKFGVIFNLIIIDCGEAKHIKGDLLKLDLQRLPFYWSFNMASFHKKESTFVQTLEDERWKYEKRN